MFCNKCGTKLPDNAQFCQNCGAKAFTEEKDPRNIQSKPSREETYNGQTQTSAHNPSAPAKPGIPAQPARENTIGVVPPQVNTQNIPTQQGVPSAFRGQHAGLSGQQPSYPAKQRLKWLLPLLAGVSIMAVRIIVIGILIMIVILIGSKEPEPAVTPGPLATEVPGSTPVAEDYQSADHATQGDMNQVIDEILTKIEGTDGFIKPDDYYQPLASFTDVDGNGVSELLVVYKVKQRSSDGFDDYNVLYDVYAVKGDGSYTAVTTGQTLYQEVGGNSGVLGLVVDKAKKPYLMVKTSSPQGDRFNDTICYIPWGEEQSKLGDEWVYLESHGTYGEEDQGLYILGDTKVDKAAFDARRTEFMSLWTDLNINRGPGNGGNNMSFSQIRSIDMNTYKFDSVG